MLAVHLRGGLAVRRPEGRLARRQADRPLPPLRHQRVRSRPIAVPFRCGANAELKRGLTKRERVRPTPNPPPPSFPRTETFEQPSFPEKPSFPRRRESRARGFPARNVRHLRHAVSRNGSYAKVSERGNPSPTGCTTMTPEAVRHAPRPNQVGDSRQRAEVAMPVHLCYSARMELPRVHLTSLAGGPARIAARGTPYSISRRGVPAQIGQALHRESHFPAKCPTRQIGTRQNGTEWDRFERIKRPAASLGGGLTHSRDRSPHPV